MRQRPPPGHRVSHQSGATPEIDLLQLMRRRAMLTGSLLRPRSVDDKAHIVANLVEKVFPLVAAGRLAPPVIDSIFAFDEAPEAHRHMESSRHIGKLVLAWDRDLARDVPTR